MPLWFWLACAFGIGLLVGLESWGWMRHRTSAIGLAAAGTISHGAAIVVIGIVASIAYGVVGGITGWDPVGMLDEETTPAASSRRACDSNYEGECLDPTAYDYDCVGGSGDGPAYAGPVEVVGGDPYDLDRDGDGFACE